MRHRVLALLVAAVALTSTPAAASCAEIPDPAAAFSDTEVVFVGTVTDSWRTDRKALVEVTQVWKGGPLPAIVVVSGADGPVGVFTSVDRRFDVGTTYVFFPRNASSPFSDNACTATAAWSDAVAAVSPFPGDDTPYGVDPSMSTLGAQLAPYSFPAALTGVAALLFGGIWALLRRRRRRPDHPDSTPDATTA